jgi:hypothetical protein
MDVVWISLSSQGFTRVRAKSDAGDLSNRTLQLTGATEVGE